LGSPLFFGYTKTTNSIQGTAFNNLSFKAHSNNSIGYKFFVSSHRPQACEDERYGIREVQKERERERERTNILCPKVQTWQLESQQRALGPMKRGSK
jgi:hypothetical protein